MDGGVAFSTAEPKTVHRFARPRRPPGLGAPRDRQPVGVPDHHRRPIFEFGFADAILQMWAAFLAEREGALDGRFGCATPEEALDSHRIFAAALRSGKTGRAEPVG